MTSQHRSAPVIDDQNRAFWTGGAVGELRIARCRSCELWLHPPRPICRRCRSADIAPQAVSGRGTVWSFTVNRYKWSPDLDPPYVIAQVELEAQPGLLLLTTLVDCDEVRIGMPVSVRFERTGDAWIPVFAP